MLGRVFDALGNPILQNLNESLEKLKSNPNIAYLNSTLFKQIEGLEGFSI